MDKLFLIVRVFAQLQNCILNQKQFTKTTIHFCPYTNICVFHIILTTVKNTLCSLFTISLLTVATPLAAFTIADSQPTPSFQVAVTNPNYSQLQNFLTAKNWQAANAETRRILESYLDPNNRSEYYYGVPNLEAIPVEVIRDLDRMWQNASGGRFGFRVQQQLWQNALKQHSSDRNAAVKAFGNSVGWTRPATKPDQTFIAGEWLTEPELTFNLNAPVGHFPWVGISWDTITSMIREAGPGCGSCTIDAMNLQGDRFYRYTPIFYRRVETALATPASSSSQTQSWQNLKLRHQIDLQNLYPNNGCPIYTRAQLTKYFCVGWVEQGETQHQTRIFRQNLEITEREAKALTTNLSPHNAVVGFLSQD